MPLVDERGRVFGRLNLLDAIVVVLLLGLIPLGYGAYALFRTPAPRLVAVEPAVIERGPNLRVTVRGEHLRPYMRVSFNTQQGITFLFQDPTMAQVELAELPPGVYDVVLYDHTQERARLPQALTVRPSPLPDTEIIVAGSFANLTAGQADSIEPGLAVPGFGEVLNVGAPMPESTRVWSGNVVIEIPIEDAVRLPATIRMACHVRVVSGQPHCYADGIVVQPTAFLSLPTPLGMRPFQVDQVRGLSPLEPLRVRVRFSGDRSAVDRIAEGDIDQGPWVNPLAAGASVVRVSPASPGTGQVTRDIELRLDGQRGTSSWTYAGAPLRIGGTVLLRTYLYELYGSVLDIQPMGAATGEPVR